MVLRLHETKCSSVPRTAISTASAARNVHQQLALNELLHRSHPSVKPLLGMAEKHAIRNMGSCANGGQKAPPWGSAPTELLLRSVERPLLTAPHQASNSACAGKTIFAPHRRQLPDPTPATNVPFFVWCQHLCAMCIHKRRVLPGYG